MNSELARLISSLPQEAGKLKLLEATGLSLSNSYDERLRTEIHTEFLYGCFEHTVNKGFSWESVCESVQLGEELLTSLPGKAMEEAVTIFKKTLETANMDNRSLTIFTDYFFSTFMKHYVLYQYVFTTDRHVDCFLTHCTLHPPQNLEPMKEAKAPSIHEYDTKVAAVRARAVPVIDIQPVLAERAVPVIDIQPVLAESVSHVPDNASLKECTHSEMVQKVIDRVLAERAGTVVSNIQESIRTTYADLDLKLEETAIPRPKQLGAPPRYPVKPVIPLPKTQPQQMPAEKKPKSPSSRKSAKSKN